MKQAVAVLDPWRNFKGSKWKKSIDVRDFILNNVTVYYGDESFLEGPTEATKKTLGTSDGIVEARTRKRRRS